MSRNYQWCMSRHVRVACILWEACRNLCYREYAVLTLLQQYELNMRGDLHT